MIYLFESWLKSLYLIIDKFWYLGLWESLSFLHYSHNASLDNDCIISLGKSLYLFNIFLFFFYNLKGSLIRIIYLVCFIHFVKCYNIGLVKTVNNIRYYILTSLQNFDKLIFFHWPERFIQHKNNGRLIFRKYRNNAIDRHL